MQSLPYRNTIARPLRNIRLPTDPPVVCYTPYNIGDGNEQALVCLSNREIVDASRGRTFHCKMANNRFFSNCFGLIYLAIYPLSIIMANVRPPSASMDFFDFSETRACSYHVRANLEQEKLRAGFLAFSRWIYMFEHSARPSPLHDIVITNIVWCIDYKREFGGGVVYCRIIVQSYCTRVGHACGWGKCIDR